MPSLALVLFCSLVLAASTSAADKPNVIIFLADDLGYADIGVNGCKDIPTPHVDAIAKNGVRLTDGYAAHPVCSPLRAALMSGMYQHRFGFEHNSGPERYASPDFGMPGAVPSLAEKLKATGYATGMVGKWHIGFREGLRPHERGFDFHFGFLSGARSYFPDNPRETDPLLRNGEIVKGEQEYLTDAFAREAVGFVERSRDKPTRAGDEDVARRIETETSRPDAVLEVVAKTGDRTRKGHHPKMAAFRVTRRYASFATVKTSCGGRI